MARKAFVGSMMIGAKILEQLTNAVIDAGGTEEDVRRLETNGGLRKRVAELIAGVKQFVDGPVRLLVDYAQPLSAMIAAGRYDWKNSDINENNFPVNRRPNGEVEMKVFTTEELVGTNRSVTSEEVKTALEKKGYRPAELPEALAYAKANPDEQRRYPIMILGSFWRGCDGGRYVPCLNEWDRGRELRLGWFNGGWDSDCRFLAVRES